MKTPRAHILMLALLLMLFGATTSASASVPTSKASDAVAAEAEFCGGSSKPAQVQCPKTQASKCYCSLSAKKTQAEQALEPAVESVTRVKLPKPAARLRQLPNILWSLTLITYQDSVPTPPPRS